MVYSRCNSLSQTALVVAAERGHRELVELLVGRYHADISVTDFHGHSAMMAAAANDHTLIVDYLSTVLLEEKKREEDKEAAGNAGS